MSEDGLTVLCLGFSRIVQRRVLPALEGIAAVRRIEIASRRGSPDRGLLTPKVGRCYGAFPRALAASRPDLVYVSTVNSEHATWVEKALLEGCHVIVDKPSFVRLEDGERLAALAEERGLCLAEATVYTAHPQISLCKQVFAEAGSKPDRIAAIFSMPPLAPDDFRYRAELGGGALWDLGPYAVSLGRIFFESTPVVLDCTITSRGEADRLETAFSMLASYPGGRTVVGHFGFDTEYRNELTLLGSGASVSLARIFTTPPDLNNELRVRIRNEERRLRSTPGDSFACFFDDVLQRIRDGGDFHRFRESLRNDLGVLVSMRQAAKEV